VFRIPDDKQSPQSQWFCNTASSEPFSFFFPILKYEVSLLWSSDYSFWLQIQRFGFDSRCYHIFWEIVGQERGPFSLVSTIEELLEKKKKSSGSTLEIREYGRRDPPRWPRGTLDPQKLALTSSTSGGRSVDIVRSRIRPRSILKDEWIVMCAFQKCSRSQNERMMEWIRQEVVPRCFDADMGVPTERGWSSEAVDPTLVTLAVSTGH
jgi:hypothetical protein